MVRAVENTTALWIWRGTPLHKIRCKKGSTKPGSHSCRVFSYLDSFIGFSCGKFHAKACILCLKAWRLGTRSLASDVCEHGIVLTEERRPTLYVEIKKRTLVIASKPGF